MRNLFTTHLLTYHRTNKQRIIAFQQHKLTDKINRDIERLTVTVM